MRRASACRIPGSRGSLGSPSGGASPVISLLLACLFLLHLCLHFAEQKKARIIIATMMENAIPIYPADERWMFRKPKLYLSPTSLAPPPMVFAFLELS